VVGVSDAERLFKEDAVTFIVVEKLGVLLCCLVGEVLRVDVAPALNVGVYVGAFVGESVLDGEIQSDDEGSHDHVVELVPLLDAENCIDTVSGVRGVAVLADRERVLDRDSVAIVVSELDWVSVTMELGDGESVTDTEPLRVLSGVSDAVADRDAVVSTEAVEERVTEEVALLLVETSSSEGLKDRDSVGVGVDDDEGDGVQDLETDAVIVEARLELVVTVLVDDCVLDWFLWSTVGESCRVEVRVGDLVTVKLSWTV
jgi:hypothetical protein